MRKYPAWVYICTPSDAYFKFKVQRKTEGEDERGKSSQLGVAGLFCWSESLPLLSGRRCMIESWALWSTRVKPPHMSKRIIVYVFHVLWFTVHSPVLHTCTVQLSALVLYHCEAPRVSNWRVWNVWKRYPICSRMWCTVQYDLSETSW